MAAAVQILIVEDEALFAEDMRSQLVQLKHEVVGIAGSGIEAVRLARAHHPNLVLMDGTLQGSLDGFETAHLIEQFLDCPIIYVTANPRASAMRYSIQKPFTGRAFASIVAAALTDRHSELA